MFSHLGFVKYYIISFRDKMESVFSADPFVMRLYVTGQISTNEMIHKMVITGLK